MKSKKHFVTWNNILIWIKSIEEKYKDTIPIYYGVPKGGMILAGFFNNSLRPILDIDYFYKENSLLNSHIVIIDDIVHTGKTRDKYLKKYPECKFEAMFNKQDNKDHKKLGWVVFPYENVNIDINENIERILQFYGCENLNVNAVKIDIENCLSNRMKYVNKKKSYR